MDGGRAAWPGIHRWYLSFCPFSCPFSPSRSSSYWNIEARTHTCDPNNCASLEKTRSKENVGENAPTRTGDQWDGINGRVGSTPVPEKTSRAQKAEKRKSKETRETEELTMDTPTIVGVVLQPLMSTKRLWRKLQTDCAFFIALFATLFNHADPFSLSLFLSLYRSPSGVVRERETVARRRLSG